MSTGTTIQPPYDVVILGASGFTGKHVLREALRHLLFLFLFLPLFASQIHRHRRPQPTKLLHALSWASHPNTNTPPPQIPIIPITITDRASLVTLCSNSRIILNCIGPFRLSGSAVVSACVETGCDYLDICGEPEFMERTEVEWDERAREKGSLVVSACGFDSVPAEMGWLWNARQWKGEERVSGMEAYVVLESEGKGIVGNIATFESAVLGVANVEELVELMKSRGKRARPVILGAPPPKGPTIEHQKELGLWAVKLPSADASVVRRTQMCLAENPGGLPGVNETPDQIAKREEFWSTVKPAYFGVKLGSKSYFVILKFIIIGIFIGLLGRSSIGRWLLLSFPSFFSLGMFRKTGPTEDEVNSASFKMYFVGRGFTWKGQT
ncbi:putative mitochondrial saccharopine dehydrogenase-like oxidoreductase [Drosera capensis]